MVKSVGGEKAKDTIAYKALKIIAAIYQADNALTDLPKEELLIRRQKEVRPLVEAFFDWVRVQTSLVSAQSETGRGLAYCLNQEEYLKVFLDNTQIPLDNNASERVIRPFCIGKRNWHLIDTMRGANASAIIYFIAETAKANNLRPYEYFTYILAELPKTRTTPGKSACKADAMVKGTSGKLYSKTINFRHRQGGGFYRTVRRVMRLPQVYRSKKIVIISVNVLLKLPSSML